MSRRFVLALAGIALLGLAIRLAYAFAAHVPNGVGDDVWYHLVANGLVHGHGYTDPFVSLGPHGAIQLGSSGLRLPTALHPPLFPGLLALGSALGASSYDAHQAIGCALGAGTVAVVGLIGRRLGGERLGLVAAAVAAAYLPLAVNDSLLMSESLYGLTIALVLLAALRLRDAPKPRGALLLGGAIGLAVLTRAEALLLVPLLAPVVWWAGARRARNLALMCAASAVLVLPWCVRNSLEFDRLVGPSTGAGAVVAGANLDTTYHGRLLGAWDPLGTFRTRAGRTVVRNEAEQDSRWRDDAARYASEHLGRLPVVVAARIGRTWSLYPLSPAAKVRFSSDYYKHLRSVEYLVLAVFAAAVCLAALGTRELRRGRGPLWLFAAPLVLVTVVSAFGFGDTRFRQAADVSIAVLAGVGVVRLAGVIGSKRARWS